MTIAAEYLVRVQRSQRHPQCLCGGFFSIVAPIIEADGAQMIVVKYRGKCMDCAMEARLLELAKGKYRVERPCVMCNEPTFLEICPGCWVQVPKADRTRYWPMDDEGRAKWLETYVKRERGP